MEVFHDENKKASEEEQGSILNTALLKRLWSNKRVLVRIAQIGCTPKGSYSPRGRSRHHLETAFRTPSENPSQNPSLL